MICESMLALSGQLHSNSKKHQKIEKRYKTHETQRKWTQTKWKQKKMESLQK